MKNDTLNIGHLSTAYHTNFILMNNEEFDKDFDIDVNWILFGTGPAMVDAFKNGLIDIGYMGLPPAAIGIDKGVPIKCVSGGHVEGTIMVSEKKYSALSSNFSISDVLSQFIGKTIGVPSRGSIHDVILNYYLELSNLKDRIEVKNFKQAEFIAIEMKKGLIDAGVGTPSLAVFTSTIMDSHVILPADNLWAYNPSYGIFFHEDLIEESPDMVLKFLKHHKNASNLLRTHPKKASELIVENLNVLNQEYVSQVLSISPKYCISLSSALLNSTMKFVDVLHKLGYIKKNLSVNDVFQLKFSKQIHPEEDHYSI